MKTRWMKPVLLVVGFLGTHAASADSVTLNGGNPLQEDTIYVANYVHGIGGFSDKTAFSIDGSADLNSTTAKVTFSAQNTNADIDTFSWMFVEDTGYSHVVLENGTGFGANPTITINHPGNYFFGTLGSVHPPHTLGIYSLSLSIDNLTPVPLPPAVFLFGSALVGLLVISRSRTGEGPASVRKRS